MDRHLEVAAAHESQLATHLQRDHRQHHLLRLAVPEGVEVHLLPLPLELPPPLLRCRGEQTCEQTVCTEA